MVPRFHRRAIKTAPLLALCAGLSFVFAMPRPGWSQTITPTTGVFAINPVARSGAVAPVILRDKYVKGIFLSLDWNKLEAKEGVFTWNVIDRVLQQASKNGKVVTLGVRAGYTTPAWVYADGAQTFQFVWDQPSTSPAPCTVESIPVPWDPVFLSKWQSFVSAMGARYRSNPALVSVLLYGLNYQSVETSLPSSIGEKIKNRHKACTGYNYPSLWQKAGYTRTRIEQTLATMEGYFEQAFPHTQLMAPLNPNGFPPIDDSGKLIPNQTGDMQINQDLLSAGAVTLGRQFAAADGGLNATSAPWPLLVKYASTIDTGYQMSMPLGKNLPAALTSGIDAGARWLQIYPTDLTLKANQSAIIAASAALH
jgi:hypothetical protein